MKFLPSQLMVLLEEREGRANLKALSRYVGVLFGFVLAFTVGFHVIMAWEGQEHSWLTGFYWTLTVMSTLGFGDITFQSDAGRLFSIFVLLSGIVLLLIVLPFAFIRFFYAPWLEAQMRLRAPRELPDTIRDHVILCRYDPIAAALIPRLQRAGIPYYVIEPDASDAANLFADGVRVVAGHPTDAATFESLGADRARLVFANLGEAANSNVTLAVREISDRVPVLALVDDDNAIDVLELSGATRVLQLKRELGEHLASRVSVGTPQAHRVGTYEDLVIAEFPIEHTTLAGRTIRDTNLRQLTGLSIVGIWERGKFRAAGPETILEPHAVPVVVGTDEQITELDALFAIYQPNDNPVLVIGGGKVGGSAARSLRSREVKVTILDKSPDADGEVSGSADRVVIGDAADLDVVMSAGLADASSVVLTTNDDAMNIFLAVYCRRLNPEVRIVSRITENWNLEAIHRAGADFALSHGSLAAKFVLSELDANDLVVLGESADLLVEPVPEALAGKPLAESRIGARTGLSVIAVRENGHSKTNPPPSTLLETGAELVMIGTEEQLAAFREAFA